MVKYIFCFKMKRQNVIFRPQSSPFPAEHSQSKYCIQGNFILVGWGSFINWWMNDENKSRFIYGFNWRLINWLVPREPETDYLDASLITVMQIHLNEPPGTGLFTVDLLVNIISLGLHRKKYYYWERKMYFSSRKHHFAILFFMFFFNIF